MALRNLPTLLRRMNPELQEGEWVFCSSHVEGAIAMFREREGTTSVVDRARAEQSGLPCSYAAAWITLTVESDLDAVGFLAAVTAALAAEGISCNVFSAFHHDHLFVPFARRHDAMRALLALQG